MPKLTKAQQRLVDILEEGGAELWLSRYSRNAYLYIYYKDYTIIRRVSDNVFGGLLDYGALESTSSHVDEDQPVFLQVFRYKLDEYIKRSEHEF